MRMVMMMRFKMLVKMRMMSTAVVIMVVEMTMMRMQTLNKRSFGGLFVYYIFGSTPVLAS